MQLNPVLEKDCADIGFHTGSLEPPDCQFALIAYALEANDIGKVIGLAG